MKTRTQSTSTEKLVVSKAIDMYGSSDEASVTRYITAMYGYIHPNRWKEIYQEVLETYKECGYSSPVDFCEDLRFGVARKLYAEKMALRNRLLEGEDVECPDQHAGHNWNIGCIEKIDEISKTTEDALDNRQLYPSADSRIIRQHIEAMSKWQNRARESQNGASRMMESKKRYHIAVDKEKRRFYSRMTDEEKELDDFLDKVEEEHYNTGQSGIGPNRLRGKYPALKASLADNAFTGCRDAGRIGTPLESQYGATVSRIAGNMMHEGNGETWRRDLRIIVQYHMKRTGMINELEKVNTLIDSSSMTHILMNVLMLLQEMIDRPRNEELVPEYISFKKDLLMFGNYYRK
ncbi:hypothetical protein EHEL_040680 [Encephalitozoon hellem ATCC 50504]|uniref:Uncharacterized protein n=1 Tax=Encephalitozoon hellem TaxID=27973 RepID=A0A9Q9CBU5_ENCHE|nr:uncharacterized protein EHEL_040680 [Encephalitozoon hellem ATCC 50504]AFM98119.1 hypothetical protein EHEL_040680 [Encephalitozoon hellem ATCC 50504]UTX42963.1 hypothetical protein GPU96_04g06950 [Encephalitozoon hellem]|eukprot:XP_003887100.1 hypothetical protein EHEL_040680 [Encephalitozoon hellem ATCC 50504]